MEYLLIGGAQVLAIKLSGILSQDIHYTNYMCSTYMVCLVLNPDLPLTYIQKSNLAL